MEKVIEDLKTIRRSNKEIRTFIFGSYLKNKSKANDIDILFYYDKLKTGFSIMDYDLSYPIQRIQCDGYTGPAMKREKTNKYDVVIIDDPLIFHNFICKNSNCILEIN
jgi:hypothetical protein